MLKCLTAAFAVALSVPAYAQSDVPKFDVEHHCDTISKVGGGKPSQVIKEGCFNMEQRAYDLLKASWGTLPADMRQHCTQIAQVGLSSSYTILKGCIEMEQSSASRNASRRFKY